MGYNIDGQDAEAYAHELLAHERIVITPNDPDTEKVLLAKAQLVAKAFLGSIEYSAQLLRAMKR